MPGNCWSQRWPVFEVEDYEVLATVKGAALEHFALQHPFYDIQVPVILGEHVTTETGTGAVHTAPDHGPDDFVIGKAYGLGTLHRVDENGTFSAATELFAGEHVYKVDAKVVEVLKERGTLAAEGRLNHSFPHCWRTKTPLIYRATPQWFISMTSNNLVDKVKQEGGQRTMDAGLGAGADERDARQQPGLVYFPPAYLGRPDRAVFEQG